MNSKFMYYFDCMIFNPAGSCAWKCENEDYDLLSENVIAHLTGKKILIKEHDYADTQEIRKKIKAAVIKKRKKQKAQNVY